MAGEPLPPHTVSRSGAGRSHPGAQADTGVWNGAKSVAFARGPAPKDDGTIRYTKTLALHYWLFGYEFPGAQRHSRGLVRG